MEGDGRIRVLLADDHTMFRQSLKEMLSTDGEIEVVGEADNGRDAVTLAQERKPDVVVLDVEMPVMGAAEAMEIMLKASPRPRILIVTMFDNPWLVRELLAQGASGYLVKSASLEELLAAVRAAAQRTLGPPGENVILAVPRGVLERVEERGEEEPSGRELEILLLAASGLSNRQIAASLTLSEATVKRHLANLYAKMKVGSRGEATRKALSEGWFTARDLTHEETNPGSATGYERAARVPGEVHWIAGGMGYHGWRTTWWEVRNERPQRHDTVFEYPGPAVRVALFITCFNDTLFPETGRATVRLLERLGHEVEFPLEQTCCGQMHFNTGYQREAIPLARRFVEIFSPYEAVVAPSGSCVGMVRELYPMAADLAGDRWLAEKVEALAPKVFELSEFLVKRLGVTDVGAYYPHRVTYHPTCHSLRMLKVGEAPLELLRAVRGIDLVELGEAKECCGFGGTFAVKNADTSAAMLSDKIRHVLDTEAEICTAGDNSCLMHIGGGLGRLRTGVETAHLAQILASKAEEG